MKVKLKVLIDRKERQIHSWLRSDREYVVLAVEQHSSNIAGYRIASEDSAQPVVFQADLFDVCDTRIPSSWVVLGLHGATIELGPEAFGRAGFWEQVFDRDPEALEAYRLAKEHIYAESQ